MSKELYLKGKIEMKEKEPEFIVSPEKLKENQEKSYEKEYFKVKEKQEKIITLIIGILVVFMIVTVIIFLNDYNKKEIKNCMNKGNSEYFCKVNL